MSVTIQVRVDETVKNEAALVLADAGLNLSTAVRMFLVRVARERALPFDPFDKAGPTPPPPHAPNEETIAAIRAAERGELVRIGHPSDPIAALDADLSAGGAARHLPHQRPYARASRLSNHATSSSNES